MAKKYFILSAILILAFLCIGIVNNALAFTCVRDNINKKVIFNGISFGDFCSGNVGLFEYYCDANNLAKVNNKSCANGCDTINRVCKTPPVDCATLNSRLVGFINSNGYGVSCGNIKYDKVLDTNMDGVIDASDSLQIVGWVNSINNNACMNQLATTFDPCFINYSNINSSSGSLSPASTDILKCDNLIRQIVGDINSNTMQNPTVKIACDKPLNKNTGKLFYRSSSDVNNDKFVDYSDVLAVNDLKKNSNAGVLCDQQMAKPKNDCSLVSGEVTPQCFVTEISFQPVTTDSSYTIVKVSDLPANAGSSFRLSGAETWANYTFSAISTSGNITTLRSSGAKNTSLINYILSGKNIRTILSSDGKTVVCKSISNSVVSEKNESPTVLDSIKSQLASIADAIANLLAQLSK